jgi:tetratricopeptide (TPR) repeat protein
MQEAVRLYQRSVDIFDRLEVEQPDDDWLRWDKAVALDALGSLSNESGGDSAAAMDYYLKALAMRQLVVFHPRNAVPPFTVKRPITLLISYLRLGDQSRRIGRPQQARDYLERGLKECEAILASDPKDSAAPYYRAHFQRSLGLVLASFNEFSAARALLAQSVQWRQAEMTAHPSSAVAKRELGSAYDALGDLDLLQNDGQLALVHYRKSFVLYEGLHKGEPTNAEVSWYLGYAYYRRGQARELCGDHAAAVKDFTESMKLREALAKMEPRDVQFQRELMLVQARLGRHREAARSCSDLRVRAAKNPQVLLDIAGGYALCAAAVKMTDASLASTYTESALQALAQAISLGYRDAVRLSRLPDLSAVRDQARFKQMLAKLKGL